MCPHGGAGNGAPPLWLACGGFGGIVRGRDGGTACAPAYGLASGFIGLLHIVTPSRGRHKPREGDRREAYPLWRGLGGFGFGFYFQISQAGLNPSFGIIVDFVIHMGGGDA